ncbi:extracellular solute-binding protein [Faecalicatena sp. AGMB00832]|uniref:Extracellular solute-binding protein n=1 Tax=Faecalicatena faecalis TaxID=2726362 RepID=A0ABS6D665_9FIRM|nr:extracellular solute-binding protein [Faecalicatena faecalis]MBU3877099.1 extracellular solute-binding protein [Faecalicatena faecalis]
MKRNKQNLGIQLSLCLFLTVGLLAVSLSGCSQEESNKAPEISSELKTGEDLAAETEEAAHTPLSRYPETVTYTLGKIAGANHANLPVGATYEDNAYTRYLRQTLNIQNKDLFELEDGATYEQAVEMSIEDNDIPDILVIKGRDTLKELVRQGMVEDLSQVYEECTTDRIKEMYASCGENLLDSATFDGKLYAFPDTAVDQGTMLIWMRADWIEELGLEEPKNMGEAMEILRRFVEADMAGDHSTVGLALSTELVSGISSTYGADPIFTEFGAVPGKWTLDRQGNVVYGSVLEETKAALEYMHELYEQGILDPHFLLRRTENLDQMVAEGKCGALFGYWWAPNNPLSTTGKGDRAVAWKPYLLNRREQAVLESYNDRQYVVVREGYEHPEIVGKYVSALFDHARYEDRNARDINDYFSMNVDPTARPMNINVDYWDSIYRTTDNIMKVMDGKMRIQELTGMERAYYETCKSYKDGNLTTVNAWAAYASRIQAVSLLSESGRGTLPLTMGEADGEIPRHLQSLENEAFLQIICGEKPVDYFEEFVEEWYREGGIELTQQVQDGYQEQSR